MRKPTTPSPDDGFERPILTVDIVLLTIREGRLAVALLPRAGEPFAGRPALIGGYIHTDEDADAAATVRRILKAKVGLEGMFFEQLATFATERRDPRGWSASIAYFALVPPAALPEGEGAALLLLPADAPGDLPFDHNAIICSAVARLRGKGGYSTIPARLLPEVFTMPELQAIYETVLGERLDQSAFRRKIADLDLLAEMVGEKRQTDRARRPTTLYRLREPVLTFNRRL